ncbi:MAG: hypothetical protein RIG62_24395 [Cyclobacteriaceae bacterium]
MEKSGKIFWQDLTVSNAEQIKNFYCSVVGWTFSSVKLGDYEDYNILDSNSQEVVAGICHNKGVNSKMPPQWLNYVIVESIEASLEQCTRLGGQIIDGQKKWGRPPLLLFKTLQGPTWP